MVIPSKPLRPDTAPALFRLLADCALSRAALGNCAVPVLILDAAAKGRPVAYVNAAFESLFGYGAQETRARSLAALLFRGDEALVQRMLEAPRRWEVTVWGKDGAERAVAASVAPLRAVDGTLTHWVVTLSDRSEVERLRAEVETLKALAASTLELRLHAAGEPAGRAQEPRVEVAPADKLHADRKPLSILQQR